MPWVVSLILCGIPDKHCYVTNLLFTTMLPTQKKSTITIRGVCLDTPFIPKLACVKFFLHDEHFAKRNRYFGRFWVPRALLPCCFLLLVAFCEYTNRLPGYHQDQIFWLENSNDDLSTPFHMQVTMVVHP